MRESLSQNAGGGPARSRFFRLAAGKGDLVVSGSALGFSLSVGRCVCLARMHQNAFSCTTVQETINGTRVTCMGLLALHGEASVAGRGETQYRIMRR